MEQLLVKNCKFPAKERNYQKKPVVILTQKTAKQLAILECIES